MFFNPSFTRGVPTSPRPKVLLDNLWKRKVNNIHIWGYNQFQDFPEIMEGGEMGI